MQSQIRQIIKTYATEGPLDGLFAAGYRAREWAGVIPVELEGLVGAERSQYKAELLADLAEYWEKFDLEMAAARSEIAKAGIDPAIAEAVGRYVSAQWLFNAVSALEAIRDLHEPEGLGLTPEQAARRLPEAEKRFNRWIERIAGLVAKRTAA